MKNDKKEFLVGIYALFAFAIWTALILFADVKPLGVNGTDIGLSTFNVRFHKLTGVHMALYTITDWLGLVPIAVCFLFGVVGLVQLVKRKKLLLVDNDILLLGIYYIVVIFAYLLFEAIPINYRPVLIDGFMEASYPSSTTLLVLSVMPTLCFQAQRRCQNGLFRKIICGFAVVFAAFMVLGRLVAGVHWFSDIVGSVLLSAGLYKMYRSAVAKADSKQ